MAIPMASDPGKSRRTGRPTYADMEYINVPNVVVLLILKFTARKRPVTADGYWGCLPQAVVGRREAPFAAFADARSSCISGLGLMARVA